MPPTPIPQIVRELRLHGMLQAIAEWQRTHGEERDYWRWRAQVAISDYKRLHLIPERLAFEAAVARSKERRISRRVLDEKPSRFVGCLRTPDLERAR